MGTFLSDAWLSAVRSASGDLPEVPGCSAAVRVEVAGGPEGPRRFGVVVVDGRLVELSAGRPAGADCTVSCTHGDAREILAGRLDPAVAYMQGRLKVDGAYERVLFGLRPLPAAAEFAAFASEVRNLSDC
jgi:hypothetical protein